MADVKIRFTGDASDVKRDIAGIKRDVKGIESATGDASGGMGMLGTAGVRAGTMIKGALAVGAATAVTGFASDAVGAFSDLEESINAVQVQFGAGADTILNFGEDAASAVGMANSEFNQLATVTGATLGAFIDDSQEVADETVLLSQRAADMASVFNTTVPEAMTAIGAALRGESEPIRRFGVQLDDATVKAKAVEMGLAATTGEVTMQHKGMARLRLIYEQTNKTAGDFSNTSDSISNRQKILSARWEDAKAALGEGLAPAMESFLGLLESSIPLIETAAIAVGGLVDLMVGTDLSDLKSQYEEINQLIADGIPEAEAAQQVLGSHLAPAMGAVASATWEAASAAAAHQLASEGEAGAIDGVLSSTKSLADEARKAVDPAFALRKAQEDFIKASTAVDEAKKGTPEHTQALLDEQEAQADLNYATETFEAAGQTAIDTMYDLGFQAGQARLEIDGLVEAITGFNQAEINPKTFVFGGLGGAGDIDDPYEREWLRLQERRSGVYNSGARRPG